METSLVLERQSSILKNKIQSLSQIHPSMNVYSVDWFPILLIG